MEKEVEEMLEGVVMFTTSILGIFLNISSIFYFARYNHQRAFHR
jgi:Co/Zn/Cd efflux system component